MIDYIDYNSSEDVEVLEGADEVCSDFVADFGVYNDGVCIWDCIDEHVGKYVPVYSSELWESMSYIKYYVEEVITEYRGLVGNDLDVTFQSAYARYCYELMNINTCAVIGNIIIKYINEMLMSKETTAHDLYVLSKIDVADVEDMVREYDLDYNNTCADIKEVVLDYIAEHKDNSRDWCYENMKREVSLNLIMA